MSDYMTELNRTIEIARKKNQEIINNKVMNDKLFFKLMQVKIWSKVNTLYLKERIKYPIKNNYTKCSLDSEALVVPLWKRRGTAEIKLKI